MNDPLPGERNEIKPQAPAVPPPDPPPGVEPTLRWFGQLMGWGKGPEGAIRRQETLARDALTTAEITVEIAERWRDFYSEVFKWNPDNATAEARRRLMQRAIDLLQS